MKPVRGEIIGGGYHKLADVIGLDTGVVQNGTKTIVLTVDSMVMPISRDLVKVLSRIIGYGFKLIGAL